MAGVVGSGGMPVGNTPLPRRGAAAEWTPEQMAKRASQRKRFYLWLFGLWPHQRQIGVLAALLLAVCLLILGVIYWAANSTDLLLRR
jgi:hypothetical protein